MKHLCLFLMILCSMCSQAYASCWRNSLEERFEEADYVFFATVIDATLLQPPPHEDQKWSSTNPLGSGSVRFRVRLGRDFKGDSSEFEFLEAYNHVLVGGSYYFFVKKGETLQFCNSIVHEDEQEEFYLLLIDYLGLEDGAGISLENEREVAK